MVSLLPSGLMRTPPPPLALPGLLLFCSGQVGRAGLRLLPILFKCLVAICPEETWRGGPTSQESGPQVATALHVAG